MRLSYASAIKLYSGLTALEQGGVFHTDNPKTISRISITLNRLESHVKTYEKRVRQLQTEVFGGNGPINPQQNGAKMVEINTKIDQFLETEIEEDVKILPVKLADLSLKENKVSPVTLSKIALMVEDLASAE